MGDFLQLLYKTIFVLWPSFCHSSPFHDLNESFIETSSVLKGWTVTCISSLVNKVFHPSFGSIFFTTESRCSIIHLNPSLLESQCLIILMKFTFLFFGLDLISVSVFFIFLTFLLLLLLLLLLMCWCLTIQLDHVLFFIFMFHHLFWPCCFTIYLYFTLDIWMPSFTWILLFHHSPAFPFFPFLLFNHSDHILFYVTISWFSYNIHLYLSVVSFT